MRVKFLRDYSGKGEPSYAKGDVVDVDDGLAAQLIEAGTAKEFPRTQAQIDEALTKYYPGDENRTPKQIAERHAQAVVQLSGDTRTDTEEQLGDDDPHDVRKDLTETAEKAAEKADDKTKAEERTAAEKAKADEPASPLVEFTPAAAFEEAVNDESKRKATKTGGSSRG